MTEFRIAERSGANAAVRTDLPTFATLSEASEFIATEMFDWNFSVYYVTPIEVAA